MQWVVYAPNPNPLLQTLPPIKKRGLSLQLLVSNGERGSLVVAGWPSWLTAVAAEAVAGWIPRTADSFHKLDKAGLQHSYKQRRVLYEREKLLEQLHKIFKLCGSPSEEYWKKSKLPHATIFKPQQPYKRVVSETFKNFPSSALSLLEVLLAIEPKDRGTASSALQNEFFTSKPLPCDPSTLPKYPPSKEFDPNFEKRKREEIAKRCAASVVGRRAANKGHVRQESVGWNFKESKVVPAPDANVEIQSSIEKRQGQCNSKCISEKYNPEEEGGYGFPLEPAKLRSRNIFSHSGQSMHPSAYGSSRDMNLKEEAALPGPDRVFTSRKIELRKQNSYWHGSTAQLSRFSNSVAIRGDSQLDMSGDCSLNSQWLEDQFDMRYSHLDDGESNQLLDGTKHSRKKDFHLFRKDRAMGCAPKNGHILNYSGPLLPREDNLEEILKEHERQIQQAVRKARLVKENKKADSENGQTESLFHFYQVRSGR
uniref:Protein kinase-like n=1 Tax=Medicago truncatula TaxID=3880 RepID=Q1SKZ8_MEDTR|nr:Protein kinase-like [Medicago truncatula]